MLRLDFWQKIVVYWLHEWRIYHKYWSRWTIGWRLRNCTVNCRTNAEWRTAVGRCHGLRKCLDAKSGMGEMEWCFGLGMELSKFTVDMHFQSHFITFRHLSSPFRHPLNQPPTGAFRQKCDEVTIILVTLLLSSALWWDLTLAKM